MLKIVFIVAFIVMSCNLDKVNLLFPDKNLSINTITSIKKLSGGTMEQFNIADSKIRKSGTYGYYLDVASFEEWMAQLSVMGMLEKPQKTYDIASVEPRFIILQGRSFSYEIQGFDVSKEFGFVKIEFRTGPTIKRYAGYINKNEFNYLFIDFKKLRNAKVSLPTFSRIEYIYKNKVHALNETQSEKLVSLFEGTVVNAYIYDGDVSKDILKRYKVGVHINKNLKGYFKFVFGQKITKLIIGRPAEKKATLVFWLEGSQMLREINFPDWHELNRLEKEIIK